MPAIFMPSTAKCEDFLYFCCIVFICRRYGDFSAVFHCFFLRNYESAYNHIIYDITSAGKMQVAIGNSAEIYKMLLF